MQCELLKNCEFFTRFRGHSDSTISGWISLYCRNIEKSETCQRKRIRQKTGKPPAYNMAPTGRILLE
jgi:hypothetical protein